MHGRNFYPPDLPSCRDHKAAFGIPHAKARNTDLSKETVGQGLTQESSVGDIVVQFELISNIDHFSDQNQLDSGNYVYNLDSWVGQSDVYITLEVMVNYNISLMI